MQRTKITITSISVRGPGAEGWIKQRCPNPYCRQPVLFEWKNKPPTDINIRCKFCSNVWEFIAEK